MFSCLSGSYTHHPSLSSQHFFWVSKIQIIPEWELCSQTLISNLVFETENAFFSQRMWQILVRFSSQLLEAHLAHKQLDYKRMRTVTYNIVSMGKCALQRNKDFLPPPLPTSMSRSYCVYYRTCSSCEWAAGCCSSLGAWSTGHRYSLSSPALTLSSVNRMQAGVVSFPDPLSPE